MKDTVSNYSQNDYIKDLKDLKIDTLNIIKFSQNDIKGDITLKSPEMLFLSIPYDRGWHTIVDNKVVKPLLCNIGFLGLPLETVSTKSNYFINLFISI